MTAQEELDDAQDFLDNSGLKQEVAPCNRPRPWMLNGHRFRVVETIEEVRSIVDAAIDRGKVALDLECEGLDSRIYYKDGKPYTVHKIVGYCLSLDGKTGYYIPVAHEGEGYQYNLDAQAVGVEIKRMCWAAQPTIKEGTPYPLTTTNFEPGKLVIYFWNAKFDQELLFPITGLDWWHFSSYRDGMLAYFAVHTDGELGLKPRSKQDLKWEGPEVKSDAELKLDTASDPGFIRIRYTGSSTKLVKHSYEMLELKDIFKGRKVKFASLVPKDAALYACSDAICTFLLCDPETNPTFFDDFRIRDAGFTERLEKNTAQVVRRLERNRILLDRGIMEELAVQADKEAAELEQKIKATALASGFGDIDCNSTAQLGEFLFENKPGCLNLEPKPEKNEKSDQWKTGKSVLEDLAEELGDAAPSILADIVKYRAAAKLKGTYIDNMIAGMDPSGEIRVNFKQVGAATARFSAPKGEHDQGFCGFPVHGIPKPGKKGASETAKALRRTFKARSGYFMLKIDYSGEEVRIAANISEESVWIKEFLEGAGDIHTITATSFFGDKRQSPEWEGLRGQAKAAFFAMLFGGGPAAIIRATNCTREEAIRKKTAFDKVVTKWAQWVKSQHRKVKADNGIRTAFNRWIEIPHGDSQENYLRASAERDSQNYAIQGSGSDIMRIALILCHQEANRMGWFRDWNRPEGPDNFDKLRILLTVHDELVFEVHYSIAREASELMTKAMQRPSDFVHKSFQRWRVPMIAEGLVGETWDAKYDWHDIAHGKPYKAGSPIDAKYYYHEGRVYRVPFKGLIGCDGIPFNPEVHKPGVLPEGMVVEAPPVTKGPEKEALPPPLPSKEAPVCITIAEASEFTAWAMGAIIQASLDPEGGVPLAIKGPGGETLLSSEEGVKVDPHKVRFFHMLFKL